MTDVERRQKHTWSELDRRLLVVLIRWFVINGIDGWKKLAPIFNGYLGYHGDNAVPHGALAAQWRDMRRKELDPYEDLYASTGFCSSDPANVYVGLKMDVMRWLQANTHPNLDLELRSGEDESSLPAGGARSDTNEDIEMQTRLEKERELNRAAASKHRFQEPIEIDDELFLLGATGEKPTITLAIKIVETCEDIEMSELPVTDTAESLPDEQRNLDDHNNEDQASQSLLSIPTEITAPLEILAPLTKEIRIGFRFTDDKSQGSNDFGFRAAPYQHTPENLVPRMPSHVCDEETFLRYLKAHLERERIATPFISITNSLIWAVQKALASESPTTAKIAIIDASKLDELYHVKDYARRLDLQNYKGWIEWAKWGLIPKAAVINVVHLSAILEVVSKDQVLKQILRLEDLPKASLRTVRKHLASRSLDIGVGALARALLSFAVCLLGMKGFPIGRTETSEALDLSKELFSTMCNGWRLNKRCPDLIKVVRRPQGHEAAVAGDRMLLE